MAQEGGGGFRRQKKRHATRPCGSGRLLALAEALRKAGLSLANNGEQNASRTKIESCLTMQAAESQGKDTSSTHEVPAKGTQAYRVGHAIQFFSVHAGLGSILTGEERA